MAQILDVQQTPPYGVQRSMTGDVLDPAVPGKYYDAADNARRIASSEIRGKIFNNPATGYASWQKQPNKLSSIGYDVAHLPGGDEGSILPFAMKYGIDLTKSILQALPSMNVDQIRQVHRMMQSAIYEYERMNDRERMAYERAGAPAK